MVYMRRQNIDEPLPPARCLEVGDFSVNMLKIEGLSFELLMNTAPLFAVLLIYKEDLLRLAKNGVQYLTTKEQSAKDDFRFIIYLILGTIPAGVIGILFLVLLLYCRRTRYLIYLIKAVS
jgi:undecaprenyl pyrophosphate phosphatase UppP